MQIHLASSPYGYRIQIEKTSFEGPFEGKSFPIEEFVKFCKFCLRCLRARAAFSIRPDA